MPGVCWILVVEYCPYPVAICCLVSGARCDISVKYMSGDFPVSGQLSHLYGNNGLSFWD